MARTWCLPSSKRNIHRNNILSKNHCACSHFGKFSWKSQAMAVHDRWTTEPLWHPLCGNVCDSWWYHRHEIAPRPHNSGHYSIEACDFPQFDTLILGVLGTPLPDSPHAPAVMLNVLGNMSGLLKPYVTENPSAHLHLYGKLEAKHNRKMGRTLFEVMIRIRLRSLEKRLIF